MTSGSSTGPLTLTQLPLFPLNTVLFPGGWMPLRIFEVRYLDMIGRCHRAGAPFGIVCLSEGDEVRKVDRQAGGDSPAFAKEITEKVGIPAERRVNELTDAEVIQIREAIDRDYVVEGDLRRNVAMNIKRLMDLGNYRGLRHRRGLPVRGQRTHTNARTRKGKAKPIAGKKK